MKPYFKKVSKANVSMPNILPNMSKISVLIVVTISVYF